jgi:hypothetical protein
MVEWETGYGKKCKELSLSPDLVVLEANQACSEQVVYLQMVMMILGRFKKDHA